MHARQRSRGNKAKLGRKEGRRRSSNEVGKREREKMEQIPLGFMLRGIYLGPHQMHQFYFSSAKLFPPPLQFSPRRKNGAQIALNHRKRADNIVPSLLRVAGTKEAALLFFIITAAIFFMGRSSDDTFAEESRCGTVFAPLSVFGSLSRRHQQPQKR